MWNLQDLMDAAIRQIVFRAIIIFTIGFLVGFFVGCDTPYSGFLRPGDIDKYVENADEETVCIADGFDSVCIKMIPGKDGKNGKDGVSIVGPQGPPGEDGKRGRRGFPGRRGKDGAIVVVETPYLLLETPSASFTLMISHGIPEATPDTYVTPVATVEVPVGGGRPAITPVRQPVSVTPVVSPPLAEPTTPPAPNLDDADGTIWHVMYRNDNGRLTVYVYPRERDIQTVPPLEVSKGFANEIQGTKEDVNFLLQRALAEENATLGTVGGVQGIVN